MIPAGHDLGIANSEDSRVTVQAEISTASHSDLQRSAFPAESGKCGKVVSLTMTARAKAIHGYPVPRNNDRCLCAWRRVARAIAAHESLLMIVCAKYCVSQNYLTHATNGGHDSRAGAT